MSMNKQLNISYDFKGYLVCQMPKDVVEMELMVKTTWGKYTLIKNFHSRIEKYHPRNRADLPKLFTDPESAETLINSDMGNDSETENPHIPFIGDYCGTCISKWPRYFCKP